MGIYQWTFRNNERVEENVFAPDKKSDWSIAVPDGFVIRKSNDTGRAFELVPEKNKNDYGDNVPIQILPGEKVNRHIDHSLINHPMVRAGYGAFEAFNAIAHGRERLEKVGANHSLVKSMSEAEISGIGLDGGAAGIAVLSTGGNSYTILCYVYGVEFMQMLRIQTQQLYTGEKEQILQSVCEWLQTIRLCEEKKMADQIRFSDLRHQNNQCDYIKCIREFLSSELVLIVKGIPYLIGIRMFAFYYDGQKLQYFNNQAEEATKLFQRSCIAYQEEYLTEMDEAIEELNDMASLANEPSADELMEITFLSITAIDVEGTRVGSQVAGSFKGTKLIRTTVAKLKKYQGEMNRRIESRKKEKRLKAEQEMKAWQNSCKEVEEKRNQKYASLADSNTEMLKKEAFKERKVLLEKANKRKKSAEKKKAEAEKNLQAIAFYKFSERSELKKLIREYQDAIDAAEAKTKEAESVYQKRIDEIPAKNREYIERMRRKVESDFPMPKKPDSVSD